MAFMPGCTNVTYTFTYIDNILIKNPCYNLGNIAAEYSFSYC